VNVAGHQLFAGARLAIDQDGRLAGSHLIGQPQGPLHDRVAIDERMAFLTDGSQHRRDQFRVRREWEILLRTCLDRANCGCRVGADTACDHRNVDPLGHQARNEGSDIQCHVDEGEIGTLAGAQRREAPVYGFGVKDARALLQRNPAGGAHVAVERSDDQEPHYINLPDFD